MTRLRGGAYLAWWLLAAWMPSAIAETITLPDFMRQVEESHPFFRKENLSGDVEQKRRDALLGDEDWNVFAQPSYDRRDLPVSGFGRPETIENAQFEAGLERSIWRTGGRFELAYDYDFLDEDVPNATLSFPGSDPIDLAGPAEFFQHSVALTYAQPLLKNRGGNLDRLEYDLQGYTVEQVDLQAMENQEGFLLSLSTRFLNWVLLTQELEIGRRRLQLAEEEMEQAQRKFDANMVEEVDVFRAKDAVIQTAQALGQIESAWEAVRADLAVQAQMPELLAREPELDLFRRESFAEPDQAVARLLKTSRPLAVLETRYQQLVREREGLMDLRKADLDLVVSGSLADGAEAFDDATSFDKPGATVALAYRYPIRNRAARADVERVQLELLQTEERLADLRLELESGVRSLLAEITALEPVLDLSEELIQTTANKTQGEVRLYEQGRNQLTFVIQSRDDEARAQLSHARNGAQYHGLILQYLALSDELFPGEGRPVPRQREVRP